MMKRKEDKRDTVAGKVEIVIMLWGVLGLGPIEPINLTKGKALINLSIKASSKS